MKLDQLLLGQIPEAIYFALFMILVKNIKEKRILFTILMILEYVFLKYFLVYNIWFQVMYFILSFIMMKMLYKDKIQITDIFTLGIASIILVITSAIPYVIVYFTIHNMLIYVILNRIIIFTLLFVFRYKLQNINKLYYKLWNRNNKPKKIKTTTFRALNLVIFNISFVIINLGILFHNLYWR